MTKEKLQLDEVQFYSLDDINYLKDQIRLRDKDILEYQDEISDLNKRLSKRMYKITKDEKEMYTGILIRELNTANRFISSLRETIIDQQNQIKRLQELLVRNNITIFSNPTDPT